MTFNLSIVRMTSGLSMKRALMAARDSIILSQSDKSANFFLVSERLKMVLSREGKWSVAIVERFTSCSLGTKLPRSAVKTVDLECFED